MNSLICPVSTEKIDNNVSRATILLNCVFTFAFMFTRQQAYLWIPALDYGIRAFGNTNYSPLRFIALSLIKIVGLKPKMVDKAPKLFASRIGFLCLFASFVLINFNLTLASISITAMATSLFFLASVGNYCVGCLIYHNLVYPYYKDR